MLRIKVGPFTATWTMEKHWQSDDVLTRKYLEQIHEMYIKPRLSISSPMREYGTSGAIWEVLDLLDIRDISLDDLESDQIPVELDGIVI